MSTLDGNHSFIAYAKEPTGTSVDGVATQLRAQIFVRHYAGIKIASIATGGRRGDSPDITTVTFDPTSVGLEQEFGATIDSDDPLVDTLRAAHDAGEAIDSLAIEHIRKRTGISPITPIHALRTAAQDGSRASSKSQESVRNIVASVNGQPSKRAESDHEEWPHLLGNTTGALAPKGWEARVSPDASWAESGYIVPIEAAQPAADALLGAMQGMIDALREDLFSAIAAGSANPADTGADIGRRLRPGAFSEGKPWDARTSDGRLNLGGYAPTRYRLAFQDARDLAATNPAITLADDTLWGIAERLLLITDRVQVETYGGNIEPDRTSTSYGEAARWVRVCAFDLAAGAGTAAWPSNPDRLAEWSDRIKSLAVERFTQVAQRAGAHLSSKTSNAQRPAAQHQAQSRPANTNLSANVLRGVAQSAQLFSRKGALDGIERLAILAREKGQDQVPFRARLAESGFEVSVANPNDTDEDGWKTAPLDALLHMIHSTMKQGQGQEQVPQAAVQGAAQAAAPVEPAASKDDSTLVNAIVSSLQEVQSSRDIQAAYFSARDQNVLDAPIVARRSEISGVVFEKAGSEEAAVRTLADAISVLRDFWHALEVSEREEAAEAAAEAAEEAEAAEAAGLADGDEGAATAAEVDDDAGRDSSEAAPDEVSDIGAATEAASTPSSEGSEAPAGESAAAPATTEPQEAVAPSGAQGVADAARAAHASGDEAQLLALEQTARDGDFILTAVSVDGSAGPLGTYLAYLVSSLREKQPLARAS